MPVKLFESELIKAFYPKKTHKKIVVNTCAVTNSAVRKSVQEIQKLAKLFPDKEIFVTGCASQVDKNLFRNLKNVKMIIDNKFKTLSKAYDNELEII